jgi:hypothetical protein
MRLPQVVTAIGFDINSGDPITYYTGYDFEQAQATIAWGFSQNEINLGYVFKHPEPAVILRQGDPVRQKQKAVA